MATTPEGKIKARLDKMLREEGTWFFSPQSGPYGVKGIPDRIAIHNGRFIGIEAKADKAKKPTALQTIRMKEITDAGGVCFVVYDDATIDEVRKFIRKR
jgi:hypothetical protein